MKTFNLISFKKMVLPVPFINYAVQEGSATEVFEKDTIPTLEGDLEITFIGHASLIFNYNNMVIHVDPFGRLADYSALPKADIILITHEHGDHCDPEAVKEIRTENTDIILTEACTGKISNGIVMKNGDVKTVKGIKIER